MRSKHFVIFKSNTAELASCLANFVFERAIERRNWGKTMAQSNCQNRCSGICRISKKRLDIGNAV